MTAVHVGRQPVYDRSLQVVGYELLFRPEGPADTGAESAPVAAAYPGTDPGDAATTRVIVSTFTEFGLERLVGRRRAFVNVTRAFVVGTLPVPFAPESAVLELQPGIHGDDEVLDGVKRLADRGYALALDDWRGEPERAALLPYCRFVKVGLGAVPAEDLPRLVRELRAEADVQLIAEGVERLSDMERCHELGFEHFQGRFLLRPDVVTARTVSPSELSSLQLLAKLADPEIDLADIEAVVRTDVGLNYRVLRAANAAASGPARRIESIRDALVLLGMQTLRSWMLLMVLASGKPDEEKLRMAMTRARACEILAGRVGGARPESAFIVGLLSSLDMLLGLSMDAVVERLPLAADLHLALAHRQGRLGKVLDAVLAQEASDERRIASLADTLPVDVTELSRAYLSAVTWSNQTCDEVLPAA
ncbi:EAL and HDOD domain-containing protein [Motilibacter aurantiacus]|uniref:EAL and HDOD domain-containing protein n=1 Tax=Motilibacter aurantiacus TaxID=2714955 RepID=UPI00140B2709|nr:HDOD domain-containing protein [Motilibacter aurantiacus]